MTELILERHSGELPSLALLIGPRWTISTEQDIMTLLEQERNPVPWNGPFLPAVEDTASGMPPAHKHSLPATELKEKGEPMPFQTFMSESGFKVLAMARLGSCEYSICLYLVNCAISNMHELITTEKEFASLIGYDEDVLRDAMQNLMNRNIVHVKVHENHQAKGRQSLRIGLQYNLQLWILTFDKDVTSSDAVLFPFKRESNVRYLHDRDQSDITPTIIHPLPTWKRILEAFLEGRDDVSEQELQNAERDAKILIETHSVDQVLIVVRHFGTRIPTLSLLASAWHHYQTLFEEETEKVDILEARHKHIELDHRLRDAVELLLQQKSELKLSEEEVSLLEMLFNHRHPRRQLFWAHQSRGRYPSLSDFFGHNSFLMLPVTSSGTIFKKKPHQD